MLLLQSLNVNEAFGPVYTERLQGDFANICVILVSIELFTSSDVKYLKKVSHSLSQTLSVKGPLGLYLLPFANYKINACTVFVCNFFTE